MTVSKGWYSPTTVGVCNPKASAVWFALVLLPRFVELRPVKAQNYWRLSFGFISDSLQITLCAVNNGAFAMPLAITTPRDSMDLPPTPHFAGPTGAASDRRARPLGFMATMAGRGGRTAMMGFKVRLATAANEVFGSTKLTFQKPLPIRRSFDEGKTGAFPPPARHVLETDGSLCRSLRLPLLRTSEETILVSQRPEISGESRFVANFALSGHPDLKK
jgi:hypothetical protein